MNSNESNEWPSFFINPNFMKLTLLCIHTYLNMTSLPSYSKSSRGTKSFPHSQPLTALMSMYNSWCSQLAKMTHVVVTICFISSAFTNHILLIMSTESGFSVLFSHTHIYLYLHDGKNPNVPTLYSGGYRFSLGKCFKCILKLVDLARR